MTRKRSMNFNFFDNDSSKRHRIPEEIYESVHVMRDDLNEIQGKPPEPLPRRDEVMTAYAGNPFLDATAGVPVAGPQKGDSGKNMKKWIMIGVVFVAVIGGGLAYFMLRGRMSAPDTAMTPEQTALQSPTTTEMPPVQDTAMTRGMSAFSVSNPNYLIIDPESPDATPTGIQLVLAETSKKVADMNPSEPVEFLVRDANNNPVAFSRFSYLLGLTVPQDTLSLIDEPFFIYFAPDTIGMRIALLLEAKDGQGLPDAVKTGEFAIPSWFGGLFYPNVVTVPASVAFRSGTYGTIPTRFVSIDETQSYSLDYAFLGKRWVIGTSKDSFRAVLTKVAQTAEK